MRIGIDATMIFDAEPTGFGIYSIHIVNELSKLHDDVVVWTIDDSKLRVSKEKIRKVLQSFRFLGKYLYLIRPLWVELFLPQLLKREKIDVFYATVPGEMSFCPVPQVLTVHDLIPITFPGDAPLGVAWNYRHRVPKLLTKASAIIVDSDHTKNDVVTHYGVDARKIHTVHLGYEPEHFSRRLNQKVLDRYGLRSKQYILSVGNAQPRKNLLRLIQAFASVKNEISHRLLILGPKGPADFRKLTARIAGLGLSDRVLLLGYVPYDELPCLYSGAALFAYLSLYEGFGLPVLEAMACGTPVLASNTTSIPEVTGSAAVLVNPADTDAIAGAMRETLTNDQRLLELAELGSRKCGEFSWSGAAQKILAILKQVHVSGTSE